MEIMQILTTAIITSLVTYFITSLIHGSFLKKSLKQSFLSYIKIHEEIYHQKEIDSFVEKKIKEHADSCPYGGTQLRIIKMLEYLIKKEDGNPELF